MKEMMKRIIALINFEQLVSKSQIELNYQHLGNTLEHQSNTSELISVRHAMIYKYWYNYVIKHFCALFLTTVCLSALVIDKVSFPAITIAGLIFFSGFYIFYYRFIFNFIFIPNLDLIKEEFEERLKMHLHKCRQSQLSNFALLLIHYVSADANDASTLTCNNNCALMLTRIYGVDSGSMKKCLELLLIKSKRNNLTERKKTELKNRFDEAYNFLEESGYMKKLIKLKEFEINFFN